MMTSKRKRRSNNPLSDARRRQQQSQASHKSKKQLAVESLWHRKTGVGFSLFVSYYGGQPPGVVVTSQQEPFQKRELRVGERKNPLTQGGAGQSRASKRRKKKKRGGYKEHEETPRTSGSNHAAITNLEECAIRSNFLLPPLSQAVERSPRDYSYLTPYLEALSRPLPLTFRLRSHSSANVEHDMKKLQDSLKAHSDLIDPVSYDPACKIYQATRPGLSKANLKQTSSSLKDLLVKNSTNGMLARQEMGSMMPVLALHGGEWLKEGCRVLDLCASPGSKTLQALELVACSRIAGIKRGRVVANDIHAGRLESLKEAISRSGLSPNLTTRVTFTNFDASLFPTPNSGSLFDAVIADVPCSGDGTIRKDSHILPMWTPATGNALHELQVRILVRALELVKVGGVVSYSTCSLNPIEDEAVVAAALRKINCDEEGPNKDEDIQKIKTPAVEIVEWPTNLLPGLVRRRGVSVWRVADYNGEVAGDGSHDNDESANLRWHNTYGDSVSAGMAYAEPTMWCIESETDLNLDRCTRLWPQDQDTGGFFVALIRKNRQLRV